MIKPSIRHVGRLTSRRLYKRARNLHNFSYVYLVVIAALVGAAVWVFYNAPNISRTDSALQERKQQANIDIDIAKAQAIHDQLRTKLNAAMSKVSQGMSPTLNFLVTHSLSLPPYTSIYACSINELDYTKIASAFRTILNNEPSAGPDLYAISYTIPGSYLSNFILHKSDWMVGLSQLEATKKPFDDRTLAQLDASFATLEDDQKAVDRLHLVEQNIEKQSAQDDADRRLGNRRESVAENTASTKLQLIQTSITRFGTISLIVFLVGIVSGLYRYTVKLAAFYQAQADALTMSSTINKLSDLRLLSHILTPKLDFGKQPATPTDQMIDLLNAVRKFQQDHSVD